MEDKRLREQKNVCAKYRADFVRCRDEEKVGISFSAREHVYPINGLRLQPEDGTTGWFIWGGIGEASKEDDFFQPLHVAHLEKCCAEVIPYLGLAPGWRFLIAPNREDVWFDAKLLE